MSVELYVEICDRFPEIAGRLYPGDAELPYMLMRHLAEWLAELPAGALSPGISKRVVEFCHWCEAQPRGATAADDLLTILVVGFYEKLFETPATRALVPKLIPSGDFSANAEYLRTWVGSRSFEETRQHYRKKR